MTPEEVLQVLEAAGFQGCFIDSGNKDYTVHLPSGAMIDRADIIDPWEVISGGVTRQWFGQTYDPLELARLVLEHKEALL